MCKRPHVSIGMPVYNGEPFLEDTLDSLLVQTFKDFELIISDNASTDGTQDICRTYASRDSRIHYFRNEVNLGAAKNYNRVFELSSGKYFKWAAADDPCSHDLLAKCVAILDRRPEVILCYPKTSIIDDHGSVIRQYDDGLALCFPTARERFRRAICRIGECNAVFGLMRSNVLRKTSLIGNYPGADRVLLTELTLCGQFWEIPERLFFRRHHARASSCNRSIESTQEFYDPETKGNICMFTWKQQFRYMSAIGRARLKPSEKLLLLLSVFRRGMSVRHRLVKESLDALVQIVRKISAA